MSGLNSKDLERKVDLVPRRLDPLLGVDRLEADDQDLRTHHGGESIFVVQYLYPIL
jgi:hypothetical protein